MTAREKEEARQDFIESLAACKIGLFAEKDNLQEAYDYAMRAANGLKGADKMLTVAAIHVLLNTIAKEAGALV